MNLQLNLSKKQKIALIVAVAFILLAVAFLTTNPLQEGRLAVKYVGILPEEYAFNVKTGQYFDLQEIMARDDFKTKTLRMLGLGSQRLKDKQPFYITLQVDGGAPNSTILGVEYSSAVFMDIRSANNEKYPLVFTYKSSYGDEKMERRFFINVPPGKIEMQLVGLAGDISVTENAPRQITDSVRISLRNASYTSGPFEQVDYRIVVCSRFGC